MTWHWNYTGQRWYNVNTLQKHHSYGIGAQMSDTVVSHSVNIGPGSHQHWINNGNLDSTLQTLIQHWFNIDSTSNQHWINTGNLDSTLIQHWPTLIQCWINIGSMLIQRGTLGSWSDRQNIIDVHVFNTFNPTSSTGLNKSNEWNEDRERINNDVALKLHAAALIQR